MRNKIVLFALLCLSIPVFGQKKVSVSSPDGNITVNVTVGDDLRYDVISNGELLLKNSRVSMTLSDRTLGKKAKMTGKKYQTVNTVEKPLFPLKFNSVENCYNLLTMTMAGGWQIQWRVYNDGLAYRFITSLKGDIEVLSEESSLALTKASDLILQQPSHFKTSCEEPYTHVCSSEWKSSDKMSELPIVITTCGQRILFSEFDLFDYPGMFLKGNGDNTISSIHPFCPIETEDDGDRAQTILKEADYIAKTSGTRTFPWRYMLITSDDRKLAENCMPMRLAPSSVIEDPSWIKPGLTTWDWLNGKPYGPDVDFKSGINYDTYKYFIDFAAEYGVKYILMDEGWALDTADPFTTEPEVRLPELIRYGESKGVGIILWIPWLTVEHNMDLFEVFEKWGIKGLKIDFMDRQDQWMVNFYERVAKEAAAHNLTVDFHGAFHPSGLNYKYPNVLSFEGVLGAEAGDWCPTENTVYLPYIRNAVGPMDYTPGMMICYHLNRWHGERPATPGVGTKAQQLAHLVLFETHLQMLADNPCRYRMWPDCASFLTGVPVSWDDTRVLCGELGEYILTAKRSGEKWYIGGITNGTPRECEISLDFLTPCKTYNMTSFSDGINSDELPMDYKRTEKSVTSSDKLTVKMNKEGGFAAVIE